MILKPTIILGIILLFFSCSITVYSFSLTKLNFDKYVKPKCFNQSTVLGQVRPNGMTVENLISMLQRAELQYPDMKPVDLLALFLQRFHYDGLKDDKQTPVGYRHSLLTQIILDGNQNRQSNMELMEKIYTDDEKCNLFFTLSHSVNQTAEEDEHEDNKYVEQPKARAPVKEEPQQYMGSEIPIQTISPSVDPKKLPPVQSLYFDDDEKPNVLNKKRSKRQTSRKMLTKKPREIGVSSFLSASTEPISIGRVLLGLVAGYADPQKQKLSQILNVLGYKLNVDVEDRELDPLMAVTISDLYGIDNGDSLQPDKLNFFGAEGKWNVTECQTKFVLNSPDGIWATAADFRGAIDGFNIGKSIGLFRETVSPSQALRFYYSKQGFVESGICKRDDKSRSEIDQDLRTEGDAYLHLWNSAFNGNQFKQFDIKEYSDRIEPYFRKNLNQARIPNPEEIALCAGSTSSNIETAELETNADIYFMFDAKNDCDENSMLRNDRNAEICRKTANIVSKITRQFKFNRFHGTISVFYNVKSLNKNDLVDDSGDRIETKLHSRLFNSTSNQCAACRVFDKIEKSLDTVEKRSELFELIRQQIVDLKSARTADQQGLPSKIFIWFDIGTVESISTDKIKLLEMEKILKELKIVHRDVQYFGVGTDEKALADLVTVPDNLINIDETNKLEQFVLGTMKAPQIFEYPFGINSTSKNVTIENYITPGYRQFWMMSPTQFIKSKAVKLSFKARDYAIEVCLGREPQPEKKKETNCKFAKNIGESVQFNVNTPCPDRFEKCSPFYFTVNVNQASRSSVVSMYCTNNEKKAECQNILQTPWYFSHTGIRGNGSIALKTSILLISISFILQKFYNHLF